MCGLINLLAKDSLISDRDFLHFTVDLTAYSNYEYNLFFLFFLKKKHVVSPSGGKELHLHATWSPFDMIGFWIETRKFAPNNIYHIYRFFEKNLVMCSSLILFLTWFCSSSDQENMDPFIQKKIEKRKYGLRTGQVK